MWTGHKKENTHMNTNDKPFNSDIDNKFIVKCMLAIPILILLICAIGKILNIPEFQHMFHWL